MAIFKWMLPGRGQLGTGLLFCLGVLPACSQDPAAARTGPSAAYAQLLRTLYRQTVPLIQPAELARLAPDAVTLLDTRTPAEFEVSHLHGARLVNFGQLDKATFQDVPRNRPVVVYCSVGYRSERVGEKLKALGFTRVQNLYGGIFEWVNEGHPVYNAQGVTTNVHPYSALWSTWLTRGTKTYQ